VPAQKDCIARSDAYQHTPQAKQESLLRSTLREGSLVAVRDFIGLAVK
jgi:hypothetical protein